MSPNRRRGNPNPNPNPNHPNPNRNQVCPETICVCGEQPAADQPTDETGIESPAIWAAPDGWLADDAPPPEGVGNDLPAGVEVEPLAAAGQPEAVG